ncbi:glycosyltransferase family 4 protein [Paenibacillus prosopidis]|uniref:Glycosyltransferase involved in cell wall biosynthesis n=1 Tax=Paenibacillus prosopidis TaxID=630520 RepID=A0A368W3Z7_9BACL|nr:glycosyltransferase family 4 protein [Paenibacillus prosopidis]RCW48871.1 glycosyltransferase involved in cell wall biosynthesis [Paenibacillus prosopidis]
MKIVIVNSLYSPHIIGGAEISTQILAETLDTVAEVHVLTTGGQKRNAGITSELINGIKVHRVPYNNLYWIGDTENRGKLHKVARRLLDFYNPVQIRTVTNLLKEIKPDLVHTQNLSGFGAGIWTAFFKAGVPIVHTLRDYSLISPVSSPISNPLIARLYRLTSLGFSKRVSAVVGISSHILNRHTESGLFPNAEHLVIPNVVDGDIVAGEKDFARKPLRIGYFGRIEPEKGVREIIDAVRSLPSEVIERLYVCGDGKLKEELSESCRNDDRIVFTGKVKPKEARELMAQVDVTVVPSIWEEPFGRVLIESYQVGTPVYASAVGGIPDVVPARQFLFAPGSSEAIQDKLKEYYSFTAEKKRMIQRQCLEHSRKFTKQSQLEQYSGLYKSVLTQVTGTEQSEKTFSTGKKIKAGVGR